MRFTLILLANFYMRSTLFGIFIIFAASCSSGDKPAVEAPKPQGPLSKSANSELFNQSFGKVMTGYYALTNGFVEEKDSLILQSARALMSAVDSLKLSELKADTNLVATAATYAQGISAELKGLLGEKEMPAKRKSLQMVGDQLYDLIRTVQYDREPVYHIYCPTAFNDQGANWLSNTAAVRNPYIPKKMITCGEIKDSIDFRPKQ